MIGLVVLGAVVVAGIVVGAFLLFGSKTLDTAKAESEIGRITKEQFGLAPTDVHCPQDIPVKAGTSTDCTARLDGQSIGYTVQQTDDKGNVHISSQSIVTQVSKLQDELARGIGSQVGVTVQARCDTNGRQVIVGATAAPIRCTVTNTGNPTDTLDVDATLDDKGNATWKSVS